MRVLFITTRSYLPQTVGGSEWSTHALCEGLVRHGDAVGVLCDLDNIGLLALRNRLVRKLTGRQCPSDSGMGYLVFRGWESRKGISEVIEVMKPEVLVVVGVPPDPLGVAELCLATSLPVVYQVRDVEFDRHGGDLGRLKAATFVSNSKFTANRLNERFGIDSRVVLPPIVAERYRVAPRGGKVLVINPDPAKGGDTALELATRRPNIPFLIQESWANNSRLVDMRKRANELPNVEWKSPVLDMRERYREARVLIAASRWEEAWGRVASEAHVSGIPVIGSRIGGLEEAIGPGGILVPRDAPIEVWLQALDSIWGDSVLWDTLSSHAKAYSQRPDLNPDYQITVFRDILSKAI
jgi:glycosyltransferase involved in cell wall biosynthesis